MLYAVEHGGKKRGFEVGNDDTDGMRTPVDEALRELVRLIVQFPGQFADLRLGFGIQVRMVVERTGDGGDIHPRSSGDVALRYLSGNPAGIPYGGPS